MNVKVLKGLLFASFVLCTNVSGIDDKLDFGHARTTSFRSENRERKNNFLPVKYIKTITKSESADKFDSLGVVCVSGGCNVTQQPSGSEDTVKADVIVHVETRLGANKENEAKKFIDDTPDIPVVVGYSGAKLDATIDDISSSTPNYKSVYIPEYSYGSNQAGSLSHRVYPLNKHQEPVYGLVSPADRSSYFYNTDQQSTYGLTSSADRSFYNYNRHQQPDRFSFLPNPPLGYRNSISSRTDSSYAPPTNDGTPDVNINIKTLPPVTVSLTDQNNILATNYKSNGIEVAVPYYDPSYHSRYYSEQPPPQYVFSSRKAMVINPVEFKVQKPSWTPSNWFRSVHTPQRHSPGPVRHDAKCACHHGQAVQGSGWYDNTRRITSVDPGSQINDKLEPLN